MVMMMRFRCMFILLFFHLFLIIISTESLIQLSVYITELWKHSVVKTLYEKLLIIKRASTWRSPGNVLRSPGNVLRSTGNILRSPHCILKIIWQYIKNSCSHNLKIIYIWMWEWETWKEMRMMGDKNDAQHNSTETSYRTEVMFSWWWLQTLWFYGMWLHKDL
jgi:hypothetical protein